MKKQLHNFNYLLLALYTSVSSCEDSKKFIEKEIDSNKIKLQWYRESYLTSTKAFVSAQFDGFKDIVLECNDGIITDIFVSNDTIGIKFYGTKEDIYSSKDTFKSLKVKIDTAVTFETWNRVYHPEHYVKNRN